MGEQQILADCIHEALGGVVDLSDAPVDPRAQVFNELGKFARFETNVFINGIDVLDHNPEAPTLEFSIGELGAT
ncbi:MAG: hypothetical protein M2R45_01939 [Verrucomicrobia subdivision 3 bacterium]|nr:hypothetical protein [Limisphaerales bacterium]MCS1416195.1 hypothetical protein [Limisphaerales bacterium]